MSADPWFKFYPSDWLGGTRGLTPAETGVYITLIAMMYENDGTLERDDKRLARLCNATKPSFTRILDNLLSEGKITVSDEGLLSNDRVFFELLLRKKRTHDAQKSARRRHKKPNKINDSPLRTHVHTPCENDAIPEARSQKPEDTVNTVSVVEGVSDLEKNARQAMPVLDRVCKILDVSYETDPRWLDTATVTRWLAGGADPETDIYPTVTRLVGTTTERINSLKYFTKAIADAKATRERPLPAGRPSKQKPHNVLLSAAADLYQDLSDRRQSYEHTGTGYPLIEAAPGDYDGSC